MLSGCQEMSLRLQNKHLAKKNVKNQAVTYKESGYESCESIRTSQKTMNFRAAEQIAWSCVAELGINALPATQYGKFRLWLGMKMLSCSAFYTLSKSSISRFTCRWPLDPYSVEPMMVPLHQLLRSAPQDLKGCLLGSLPNTSSTAFVFCQATNC